MDVNTVPQQQKSSPMMLLWHRGSRKGPGVLEALEHHICTTPRPWSRARSASQSKILSQTPHLACASQRLSLEQMATQARAHVRSDLTFCIRRSPGCFDTMLQTCSESFSRVVVCSTAAHADMCCREANAALKGSATSAVSRFTDDTRADWVG